MGLKVKPFKAGERVQQRYAAQAAHPRPVVVADAETLAFVLDPAGRALLGGSNGGEVALSVRQGNRQLAALGNVAPGSDAALAGAVGVRLAAGDVDASSGYPTYLSIQTAGVDTTPDASLAMVERLRVGPGNAVTLSPGTDLDVLASATVRQDLTVQGSFFSSTYLNLVDNHTSSSIFLPPTANALRAAFVSLSNYVATTVASNAIALAGAGCGNNSGGAPGAVAPGALVVPSIACTNMWVTGAFGAASYCNLVTDYTVSDPTRPASASALYAAYTQLSNHMALTMATHHLLHAGGNGSGSGSSNGNGNGSSNGSNVNGSGSVTDASGFRSDVWLPTPEDGIGRLLFPAYGTQMP
ncbi:hypothetical protein FOA52_001394, partial [Chlamydomonas sp. UWO 241]